MINYTWGDAGGSGSSNVGQSYPATYPAGERYAGQKTLRDYYRENQLRCEQMREKLAAYNSLLLSFQGPESTWIRWLIKRGMQNIIAGAQARGLERGWLEDYMTPRGEMPEGLSKHEQYLWRNQPDYGVPAIPDWMWEYIVPVTTQTEAGKGRGTRTRTSTTYTLRPLGAQEKLSAEQQNMLAGWLAWAKAGFPSKFSEQALIEASDIERHWTPYVTESQAMFPKAPPGKPQWATAVQR